MKEQVKKVRTNGKVVSEVNVPEYENLQEILDSEPEDRIVSLFNNANSVRIMGNERSKFAPNKKSKKARRNLAFNLLTTEELMEVAQDANALTEKLDSDEMQARVDEHLKEQVVEA